jgi:hypothetical protein
MAVALFFLYGLAAGFLLVRLRRAGPASRALQAIAWVTMSTSFALAILLLAWGFWPR